LQCHLNQLTTLDLSQNTVLNTLRCDQNQLNCLNVKNGNNNNFSPTFFADSNPTLFCIEVDNVAYSTANWTYIDPQTSFSTNCNNACSGIITSINKTTFPTLSMHPNPTSGQITISLEGLFTGSLRVFNSLGQAVLEDDFKATRGLDINLNEPSGLYFLQLEIDGKIITKKVLKE